MSIKIDWRRFWPKYWFQNYRTDYEWDSILNKLLDSYPITPLSYSDCAVKIGPVTVWVKNYPYAYGSPYLSKTIEVLPTVKTRNRLRAAIQPLEALQPVFDLLSQSALDNKGAGE